MALIDILALTRDPLVQVSLAGIALVVFLSSVFLVAFFDAEKLSGPFATVAAYGRFAYACFFKPHSGDGSGSQQDALESFYKAQATAYDATRNRLLHGREDMLCLVASHLKQKNFGSKKPIWVDVRLLQRRWRRQLANCNIGWWWYRLEH
jgi:betaine lipid synthase